MFPLTFALLRGGGQRVNVTSVELMELNNRTDYMELNNASQLTGITLKVQYSISDCVCVHFV